MSDFEFDKRKSQINLKKHGIDFGQAQALWKDPGVVEVRAKTEDETRFLVIGRIRGKHWSAVVTPGGGRIRIISVRRSRAEEVLIYESQEI
ncbi:MAG: BrnT family toxin [Nitrospira sp.]|nr:BrnT family toxin [Nitrospira sp.]